MPRAVQRTTRFHFPPRQPFLLLVGGAVALLSLLLAAVCSYFFLTPTVQRGEELVASGQAAQGIDMLRQVAEAGNIAAAARVGRMYAEENNPHADRRLALAYLRQAADGGDRESARLLGFLFFDERDDPELANQAFHYLRKSADLGDGEAASALGWLYRAGPVAARDPVLAKRYFGIAAATGDPAASAQYGRILFESAGPVDKALSARYLEQAHHAGYSWVAPLLGELYYTGMGVGQDYGRARDLFAEAAGRGDSRAEARLGEIGLFGLAGPADFPLAVKHFTRAARMGDTRVYPLLGDAYRYGDPPDPTSAEYWYRLAAENGDVRGMNALAEMYLAGKDGQDGGGVSLALEYLAMAAEYGGADPLLLAAADRRLNRRVEQARLERIRIDRECKAKAPEELESEEERLHAVQERHAKEEEKERQRRRDVLEYNRTLLLQRIAERDAALFGDLYAGGNRENAGGSSDEYSSHSEREENIDSADSSRDHDSGRKSRRRKRRNSGNQGFSKPGSSSGTPNRPSDSAANPPTSGQPVNPPPATSVKSRTLGKAAGASRSRQVVRGERGMAAEVPLGKF